MNNKSNTYKIDLYKNIITVLLFIISYSTSAQRGLRVGYIDTEYILSNLDEYKRASSELSKQADQWKKEIETGLSKIKASRAQLENEKILLTPEIYEERLNDITFEEQEILDYQLKRFGSEGDLILQKKQLIKPIQDQIFNAVQEIAKARQYDFIFDKSADLVMLFATNRYDLSDIIVKTITRNSDREQAKTRKERKELDKLSLIPEVKRENKEDFESEDDLNTNENALTEEEIRAKVKEERKQKNLEERKRKLEEQQKLIDASNRRRDSLITVKEARRKGVSFDEMKAIKEEEKREKEQKDKNNMPGPPKL